MMTKRNKNTSFKRQNVWFDTLKNTFEFGVVFKNGARFNKDFMTIYAMPLRDFLFHLRRKKQYDRKIDSNLLIGFSISKKVAKACKRNLLRRRIKAIIHGMTKLFVGYVFVFICRKGAIEFDFNTLSQHISYSTKRLTKQRLKTNFNKHINSVRQTALH